jgi:hypothetical protein
MTQWLWDKYRGRRLNLVNRSVSLDDAAEHENFDWTATNRGLEVTPLLTKRGVAEAAGFIQRHTHVLPHTASDYIPRTQAFRLN